MDKMNIDMFSFLAMWFNNLRKNVFRVEVVNNQKDDTKSLEVKLDEVVNALKELPEERTDLIEKRMKEYIILTNALNERKTQRVEVTNLKYPKLEIPRETQVHGIVSVSNLPKVQEVSGDVSVKEFPNLLKGIQVVVDKLEDLKLDFAQSFKGFGTSISGVAGSREALKITDGTKNATLTTTGAKNALDVNITASSAGGDASAANQTTMITSLSNIDTDTSAIQTAVETIDNAVSGAGFNITQQGGVAVSLNTGVRDSGTQRVTIATNDVVPVSQSGTWDEVGINDSGNSITIDNAQLSVVGTGTEAAAMRVTVATDSTGVLSVDDNGGSLTVDGTVAVTNAGTFVTQENGALLTSSQLIDDAIYTNGDTAGKFDGVGGQAVSSENAAATTTKMVKFVTDLVGKLIVLPYANPENFVSGAITSAMTGTTSTSLVAAPAGSLRNYITTIICSNAHATVGTDIAIQDGSGGTTLLTIPAAAVYGGAAITLPTPLRQPTAATALFCANVTTGASTKVSAVGYKGL